MGVEQALEGGNTGLDPVGSLVLPAQHRTSVQVSGVTRIADADPEPQAVIIIGASDPAAQAIKLLREKLGVPIRSS